MKSMRVFAIVLIGLILVTFIGILIGLILPNYPLFYLSGCLLVAELVLGFVLKAVHKKKTQKADEEAPEKED